MATMTPTTPLVLQDPQPRRCNATERLLAVSCAACRTSFRGPDNSASMVMVRGNGTNQQFYCITHFS